VILQDVTKFRLLDDAKTTPRGHREPRAQDAAHQPAYGALPLARAERRRTRPCSARLDSKPRVRTLNACCASWTICSISRGWKAAPPRSRKPAVRVDELLAGLAQEAQPHFAAGGQRLVVAQRPRARRGGGGCRSHPARVSEPADQCGEICTSRHPGDALCRARAARLRAIRCTRRRAGIPAESAARVFRPVLPGAGRAETRRRTWARHRPRDRRRARRHESPARAEPGKGSDFYFLLPV